jgi:hypothetical protein
MGIRWRAGDRAGTGRVRARVRRLLFALVVLHTIGGLAASADQGLPPSAVTAHLRVEITFDGRPLSARVEASAMEEIRGIWAPYGVDVFSAEGRGDGRDGDVALTVIVADRPSRRLASGALGSIVFRDEAPQPSITMYQDAIDELVSTVTIAGCHSLQWPTAFHEAIVGRVFGRALAHEFGHFLLRARHHSATGLMRAPHRVPDLVSVDRQHFALSAAERTRLVAFLSTAAGSSPGAARPSSADLR